MRKQEEAIQDALGQCVMNRFVIPVRSDHRSRVQAWHMVSPLRSNDLCEPMETIDAITSCSY